MTDPWTVKETGNDAEEEGGQEDAKYMITRVIQLLNKKRVTVPTKCTTEPFQVSHLFIKKEYHFENINTFVESSS